ncbi:MAG: NTP transferase domain-containing protein [Ignavibacteriales bacterium]|nr:NTP transferase domain-containing protein [Ignavibacteriales bacterium]
MIFLKLPVVNDIFIGKGPLAGIHSALKNSSTEKNFIISCDMPLISVELIKYLINLNSEKAILLPKSNRKNSTTMWHLLKISDRMKLKIFLSYQKKIKVSKEAFTNCLKEHQSKLLM